MKRVGEKTVIRKLHSLDAIGLRMKLICEENQVLDEKWIRLVKI